MNGKILKIFMLCMINMLMVQPVYALNQGKGNFAHSSNVSDLYVTVLGVCCVALLIIVALILLKLKKVEKKVQENIMTDADTGTGNLAYFENCFNNRISDSLRSNYYIIYFIIDSNYLSVYHGEDSFTKAVKHTADTLRAFERQGEFSARITENGFAFALNLAQTDEVGERVTELVDRLNSFFDAENESIRPYFHSAVYNLNIKDKNCGFLLYNLRKNCNKLNCSDTQVLFCDADLMNNAIEEELFLEKIEKAFDEEEFKLYLQFIVDNKTKKITSAEALSRWEDSNGDIIMPSKYLDVMEKAGLISKLDYYMFERVCRQLHIWKDTEFKDLTISCNFTRITISGKNFISNIEKIAEKYEFDRKKLLIEITEDTIEKNLDVAMNNIKKSKQLGFRIALDDMGSGYTSLINLCEYPLDVVKIDRDILLRIDKNNGKDLFVGIIFLAHSLNLEVVCEGVETEKQNTLVSETACDYIQGWYYSRAMSVIMAENFAREYAKRL